MFFVQVSLQDHFVFISRKLAGNGGNQGCVSVLKINILLSVTGSESEQNLTQLQVFTPPDGPDLHLTLSSTELGVKIKQLFNSSHL